MTTDRQIARSNPTEYAQRFVERYGDALLTDGVALTVDPGGVGKDFVEHAGRGLGAAETVADGVTCLAVVGEPDDFVLPDTNAVEYLRQTQQEIAVRLADDSFPLVISFFEFSEAGGHAYAPSVYAVGPDGVSDDIGQRGQWPTRFRDDFRVDPGPAVELAALRGAAWLGVVDAPDVRAYEHDGPDRGDITKYFETHEPGGADALTAMTVFAAGGVGLFWFFSRRARLMAERADAPSASRLPTPVPITVLRRLPELLEHDFPAVDPQAATTEEALDTAVELRKEIEDYELLRDRIAARLVEIGVPYTPQALDPVLPPVEAAALLVLHTRLVQRVRGWEAHVRHGTPPDAVPVPRFCALNPFHGQTTVTSTVEGGSAAIEIPVCAACRDAGARGEPQDVLRVRAGSRTRAYVEVDDAYAQSMFGALTPLATAAASQPASGPAGPRGGTANRSALLLFLGVPVLILLGSALAGAALSILLAGMEGEQFHTAQELAERAADTGPTVFGYPVLNWLRGAGMGALFGVALSAIAAAVFTGFRNLGSGDGEWSGDDGLGPSEEVTGEAVDQLDRPGVRTLLERGKR